MTDEALDLRLVPAAACAWIAALVTVLRPAWALAVAVPAAAVAAVAVPTRSPRGATVALAALVLLGGLGSGAVIRHERSGGPLVAAAAVERVVTLHGTVAGEPTPVAAGWGDAAPRVRYALGVTAVEGRDGSTTSVRGEVVVLGTGDPPAAGAGVVVAGRLRPPASRTDRAVAVLVAGGSAVTVRDPTGVRRWVGSVRSGAREVLGRVPGDAGGLLLGVALGDTSAVDATLSDAFAVAGLTHLVAVSGAHFAIVGALVAAGAATCRLPRPARAVAVLLAGAVLVLLVGPQPSVLRAAVMGSVSLVGLLAGRPARAPAALAAAVVVLLLADPWLSVELGFVLSVAATAAIVLLAVPWADAWADRWANRWADRRADRPTPGRSPVGRGVAAALAVPFAAQLACGPVLLAVRPQVGLYAVVANVLVAPAVGPATVCGVAAALLAPLWPGAALVLAHLGGAACWWIATVGRRVAAAPGAGVGWAPGWVGVVALAAASVAAAVLLSRRRPVGT